MSGVRMTRMASPDIVAGLALGVLCIGLCGCQTRVQAVGLLPELSADPEAALGILLEGEHLLPSRLSSAWRPKGADDTSAEYVCALVAETSGARIGEAIVYVQRGRLRSVIWRIDKRPAARRDYLRPQEAWRVAEAYGASVLPRVFGAVEKAGAATRSETPSPETDAYGIQWQVQGRRLYVEVNAFTGEITHIWLHLPSPPPSAKELQQQRELRAKALELVSERMQREGLPSLREQDIVHEIHQWHRPWPGAEYQYGWDADIVVTGETDSALGGAVQVVSTRVYPSGRGVVGFAIEFVPAEHVRVARREGISVSEVRRRLEDTGEVEPGIREDEPTWTEGGQQLVFLSNRHLADYPPWRPVQHFPTIVSLPSTPPAAVFFDEHLPCIGIAACRNVPWIAYRYRSFLRLQNTQTGEAHALDMEHSGLPAPIFMANAHPWVLGPTPMQSGRTRWMLFRPPADGGARLAYEPIAGLTPDDLAVAFDDQDRQVAVLSRSQDHREAGYRIQIARIEDGTEIGPREQVLVLTSCAIPTVSWCGEGERLLVASMDEAPRARDQAKAEPTTRPPGEEPAVPVEVRVALVSTADGSSTAIDLSELRDPETGDHLELAGAKVTASGSGRIAFAAGPAAVSAFRGCRIYTCDLRGSGLVRVTPLEDEPVSPYVFPETGKTAFEVANEIRVKFAQ